MIHVISMIQKTIILAGAALLCMSLAGCGGNETTGTRAVRDAQEPSNVHVVPDKPGAPPVFGADE